MKTEPELTPEEEERFDELFQPQDRYSLSYDWKSQFLAAVDEHRKAEATAAPSSTTLSSDSDAIVVDLAERRRTRVPILLVAAMLLVAVGVGTALLIGGGNTTTGGLQELPLLDATREVEAPNVASANAPEGTTAFVETVDGDVVAVVEVDGSEETTLYRSEDLTTWDQISDPLPLVDAVAEVSGDTWYIVGGDAQSIIDLDLGVGTRLASDAAAFNSTDSGASWEPVDISIGERRYFEGSSADRAGDGAAFPTAFQSPQLFSIARLGEEVVVTYTSEFHADWNTFGREAGIITDAERMFPAVNGSDARDVFIVGQNRFELRTIESDDITFAPEVIEESQNGNIDLRNLFFEIFPAGAQPELQRLTGAAFEQVQFPVNEDSIFALDATHVLTVVDEQLLLVDFFTLDVWATTDGQNWELADLSLDDPEVLFERDDWQVQLSFDEALTLEQTADGSGDFSPVPLPALEAQPQDGFPTDFGGAVVWQDAEANSLRSVRSVVSNNGYEFEFFDNFTVTVTDPAGVVIADRQSQDRPPQDRVLADAFANVTVFGDDGEVLAAVTQADVEEAFFTTGIRAEAPPARFITWATGPDDWRFAELNGLDAALWIFQPTDNGLLASAIHDPSQALIIDWPDQFGE